MRKKNLEFTLDNVMWFIVYTAPIIILIFASTVTPLADIEAFLLDTDFVFAFSQTELYQVISSVFGDDGILPFFYSDFGAVIMSYLTYFIIVTIIHLFVDFLVFIPRLSHKWLNKLFGGN